MQNPLSRYAMDQNYQTAWNNCDEDNDMDAALIIDDTRFTVKNFARKLQDASYPVDIATGEELNKNGELIVKMKLHEFNIRDPDLKSVKSTWMTFRDGSPSAFVSLHTGHTAARFEKHWVDIDEKDFIIHVHNSGLRTDPIDYECNAMDMKSEKLDMYVH